MSIIGRTAGLGRTLEELQWDLNYLVRLWHAIEGAGTPHYRDAEGRITTDAISSGVKNKRENPAPFLIFEESSLVIRAIRDYFHQDIGELLIDTESVYEQARQFMGHVMPGNVSRVKMYHDDVPLFSRFQIEHQIETAYARQVPLPSGGAIVIDHTEAMVAIDVNSARVHARSRHRGNRAAHQSGSGRRAGASVALARPRRPGGDRLHRHGERPQPAGRGESPARCPAL